MAKEYASRNILVNCIAPGFIETDMTSGLPEAREGHIITGHRVGAAGPARGRRRRRALFLASDLAGYITGQVLVVDGGMVI